jgi:hypothetical protein
MEKLISANVAMMKRTSLRRPAFVVTPCVPA